MTRFYVDAVGGYIGGFDGAAPPPGAIEVPFPPKDARHVWAAEKWNIPAAVAAADTAKAAIAELSAIDLASIRSMREWIAAQPTAPQLLKDREAAAIAERAKL